MKMNDPASKAKWVLATKGISDIPAQFLEEIAQSEKIRFQLCDFPDDPDLDGLLLFKGDKRAIVVNTYRRKYERNRFTFAHELGHHFLAHQPSYESNGQTGFRCSPTDISKGRRPQEREANRFAVELLMPEERFRIDMAGSPFDFVLINALATKYMVSKHACSNRLLAFTREPHVVLLSNDEVVTSCNSSRAAGTSLTSIKQIPPNTIASDIIKSRAFQKKFQECDPAKWSIRLPFGTRLYSCTHGKGTHFMTILRW